MKTPLAALSALAAATLALTGCGAPQSSSSSSSSSAASSQAASGKIEVFAAASLNNAGADLEKAYEAANPGVDVTFVYEGSAKLVNQIEQGATP
ncbi:MAG: substrate-binding domain-containing protein, partial [Rothia mucilaginosa]